MNTNKLADNVPPAANTVRICASSDDDAWDAYVAGNPESSLYHQSAWKRVIVTSFGHESIYLMSFDPAGQCNGVLPLIHIRSWLFGNFISSLPFFNYGGLCVDDPAASDALLAYAADFGKSSGASYIEIRSTKQLDIPLPSKTNKVCMKLNLPPNAEELWARFPSKLRSQIRRAEKEGMTVRIGGIELLPAFYEVFAENMRDLGTPVYAKSFFRNIFKYFSSSARICAVFDSKQKPVAAGFLLGFRNTIEIPWASSLKEANRFSPNMLMYWSALKYACDAGFRTFDFGRSTHGEGTFKFKQQWGAEPEQSYWYYWLNEGQPLPQLNPGNPKYRLAIDIWRKLPVPLTKIIGPRIVRNIP